VPIAMFPPIFNAVRVPTDVRLDVVTPAARVSPVKVPAAAGTVIVMGVEPSKLTPLIVLPPPANLVAVSALPVKVPVTLPDKAPWKVVAVMLVAPVIS